MRLAVPTTQSLEEHSFDESYIAFLDDQIALNARGDAWTERLRQRRARLFAYCHRTLIRGRIVVDDREWSIEVDPEAGKVVHWETYD